MFNYTQASLAYAGRKNKYVGKKIHNNTYMTHDADDDCYVLSQPANRWNHTQDPVTKRWIRPKPKDWKMVEYVRIYPTHIVFIRAMNNQAMYKLWGVRCISSGSVKQIGHKWSFGKQRLIGELPILLKDGELSSLVPPKVRTFDETKRKEMLARIKDIREQLIVRHKLGVFEDITSSMLHEYAQSVAPKGEVISAWQVLNNPAEFLKYLRAVDPEKFETYYPILWLCQYINRQSFREKATRVDQYDALIRRMKEKMRRELGVVSYVEATQ